MAKRFLQKKFKGFDELRKVIRIATRGGAIKKGMFEQIADFMVKRIQAITRTGYSIADKSKVKLKQLSKSYVEMRKGKVRFRKSKAGHTYATATRDEKLDNVDPNFFRPTKSNLTFTGQMLDDVRYDVYPDQSKIVISVDDSNRFDEKLTNKQVAKHVAANGRPFLGLDQAGLARVSKIIKATIRENLIKSRLKKR
jgi:hypothetical protein